ncbi:MAG TPA: hypothetical protein VIW68_08065, partial [Candidatus Sulfotelmatobacter sp.]
KSRCLIGCWFGRAFNDDSVEGFIYGVEPQTKLTKRAEDVDVNFDASAVWARLGLGPQRQVILPSETRAVHDRASEGLPREVA